MKSPILGSAYVARSVNAADNRMVNLFPEVIPEGGKEPGWLQRAPGLRKLANVGDGPIRGLWAFNGGSAVAFVVSGKYLYKLDHNWNATKIGYIKGTEPVSMADNGTQLFIAANGPGYIYNITTNTVTQIGDPDFPGAVTVGYLDGYFVFNEPNSQKIWVTSLLDGLAIDPLDFASAEGSPDGVVGIIIDHREVWVMGTNSTEVWYNAGLADFPLARIQGAYNELGCIAPLSLAKMDNTIFWLGQDARGRGVVYRADGYNGARVSTHAIEWQLQQYDDLTDAVAYTYQQDGHSFYVLNVPSGNTTWVYDAATNAWHERAALTDEGTYVRHRANNQMFFNNQIVVGDYENNNIYAYDLNYYADDTSPQRWLRSWRALPTGGNNLKRTAQHTLQLDCETGVGLANSPAYEAEDLITEDGKFIIADYVQNLLATQNNDEITTQTGDFIDISDEPFVASEWPKYITTIGNPAPAGYDPQVMLRWSDDGGHTWSNEHWKSMGKLGQYGYRTIWRRLGMTMKLRDRVYEVSGSDPVKIAIVGAELIVSPTNA